MPREPGAAAGPPAAAGSLFARLRAAASAEWEAYTHHPFVEQLARGTLSEESFRHYLIQDYRFLIHFARAWALAAFKADTLEDMRGAAQTLSALIGHEMNLHLSYCARWGITPQQMEAAAEARANLAYTRFVIERGLAGDVLDLHVALAPCVVGYAEIGARLGAAGEAALAANPYREWIRMYAGPEYQELAAGAVRQLDRLAAARSGPGRFDALAATFRQATRLEVDFWEMGLTCAT